MAEKQGKQASEHPGGLTFGDLAEAADPFALIGQWMAEAAQAEPNADAAALASVDSSGLPNARMVLVKEIGPKGLAFYTNTESAKGRELDAGLKAALVFYWKSLDRQVRVRGAIERVSEEEADAYFASRPRGAQIGAWASAQSRPLASRKQLEDAVAATEKKYEKQPVPRPPHWTGYRLIPLIIEFWAERPFRLHDRVLFERASAGAAWRKSRLYP